MSILYFAGALLGIVLLAIVVNRLTGTRASYIDALQFAPGEAEIWRDAQADAAFVPRLGGARRMSFPRLRRHTVVWTDRRVVISQKVLFSQKRMITHEVRFAEGTGEVFGGFFGRGYLTILAHARSFGKVNEKPCALIRPTDECGARLNLEQVLIFTDRLAELEARLSLVRPQPATAT